MTSVCIFCEEWGSGGIEAFLLNVLSCVDRSRYTPEIVTACINSDKYLGRLKELQIALFVLPGKTNRTHMKFRSFYKWIICRRYDAAYFNLYQGLALRYVRMAEWAGIPVRIVHSHNTNLRKSALRQLKLAVHNACKIIYKRDATYRFACSKAAARFLFPDDILHEGKWRILPNGIHLDRFKFNESGRQNMRTELDAVSGPVIGCIGRLCYQKNQSFLLRAFEIVLKAQPQARLILVGEGEDLVMLRLYAKQLCLEKSVVFYGVTDRIPELLWAFDVLAMPSLFEGLGIVAIEAQAAGLPVICSDQVPQEVHLTELVEYLPLDSADHWARALLSCIGKRQMYTEKALRDAGYSIEDVTGTLQNAWLGNGE